MTRKGNEIILCKIRFSLGACKNWSAEDINSLSDTARHFFRFVQAFGIKLKLRNFLNIWMVEDRLQDLDSSTCGIFQLYFYNNLFNLNENSNIQDNTKLKKNKKITSHCVFSGGVSLDLYHLTICYHCSLLLKKQLGNLLNDVDTIGSF